jgi:hypothetical protein
MKTINVPFEDGEIEQIEREKGKRSWRAFILGCAGIRVGEEGGEKEK